MLAVIPYFLGDSIAFVVDGKPQRYAFPDLPPWHIKDLLGRFFRIRWTHLTASHRKSHPKVGKNQRRSALVMSFQEWIVNYNVEYLLMWKEPPSGRLLTRNDLTFTVAFCLQK